MKQPESSKPARRAASPRNDSFEGEELRLQPLDESTTPALNDAGFGSDLPAFEEVSFSNLADSPDFGAKELGGKAGARDAGMSQSDFPGALVQAQPIREPGWVQLAEQAASEAIDGGRAELLPDSSAAGLPATGADEAVEDHEAVVEASIRRKFFMTAAPSWLISLVVHVALILILAAITLDPVQRVISILQASTGDVEPSLEQFDLQGPSLDASDALTEPVSIPSTSISDVVAMPELTSPLLPEIEANVDALEMNRLSESIMPSALLNSTALAQMSVSLNSRSTAAKSEMLERFGGTAASEKSVALALSWLAKHQASDGGWNFAHSEICRNQCQESGELRLARNGATAMALLPFLGAGQTHLEGQYKMTVKRGLAYLINRMKVTPSGSLPTGSWHEPGGTMYSHGLASIAVCEAYAMTRDPDLLQPAQLSLNFLIYAQSERDGGWRYGVKEPGDTSVVGWCLMALKSGKMGSLVVPQNTFRAADGFLDFVSTNDGAYYGYTKPTSKIEGRQATTAVGLLCRMYMGYPKEHPGLQEGVQYLSKRGPSLTDLYYTYYATQVMRHHGGDVWERWNSQLRDKLIKAQQTDGHAAGSWAPSGPHSEKGGRLYATSLATMILEVYYRHMPLYSDRSSDDDFEI